MPSIVILSSNILGTIGRCFILFLQSFGCFLRFFWKVCCGCCVPPFFLKQFMRALFELGYSSLPIVGLTSVFTGMVLALQSYTSFHRISAEGAVAAVVVLSIVRELGPVIAALMVTSRAGAAIAAEIATMRVTDQIDALLTLSVDPYRFLVIPRFVAGIVSLPILVFIADVIGIFGGYLISIYRLGFNPANYLNQTALFLQFTDVMSGLYKAAFFGGIIALFSCYAGFHAKQGAAGVGRATTKAVMLSSVFILLVNYLATDWFFT